MISGLSPDLKLVWSGVMSISMLAMTPNVPVTPLPSALVDFMDEAPRVVNVRSGEVNLSITTWIVCSPDCCPEIFAA